MNPSLNEGYRRSSLFLALQDSRRTACARTQVREKQFPYMSPIQQGSRTRPPPQSNFHGGGGGGVDANHPCRECVLKRSDVAEE